MGGRGIREERRGRGGVQVGHGLGYGKKGTITCQRVFEGWGRPRAIRYSVQDARNGEAVKESVPVE